jgi:hypothetical protein
MQATTQSSEEKWDQLTEQQREKLLEKHRDCHTFCEWWDGEFECFIECMREIGIDVVDENIFFSGLSSQGDGAAFKGRVNDWAKMFKHLGLLLHYDWFVGSMQDFWFQSHANTRGYTMSFDRDLSVLLSPYDELDEPLQHMMWSMDLPSDKFLEDLDEALMEVFNNAASKLYKSLEEEYDYLTSDEVVKQYILDHREEDIDDCLEHG